MSTAMELHLKTIREAPARLREASDALAKLVAELAKDEELTPEARKRRIEAAKAESHKIVTEVRAEVAEARERVERYSTKELAGMDDRLEAGLDHDRTWQRLSRRLDAGTAPAELVAEVTSRGNAAAIKALRKELPDYLQAKAAEHRRAGTDSSRQLAEAVETTSQQMAAKLDRALLPHLPKAQRAALGAKLELPHRLDAFGSEVAMLVSPSPTRRMAAAYAANDAKRELDAVEAAGD